MIIVNPETCAVARSRNSISLLRSTSVTYLLHEKKLEESYRLSRIDLVCGRERVDSIAYAEPYRYTAYHGQNDIWSTG